MPKKLSAGLLMYRKSSSGTVNVFLVHPGGPFWAKKDQGAWSLPKGEYVPGDDPLAAARREFLEETGFTADGPFLALTPIKQPSGKLISAWAFEGDCNPALLKSNTFSIEWPPRSGQQQDFPEVDRAEWFEVEEAKKRIIPGQVGFLADLEQLLGVPASPVGTPPRGHSVTGNSQASLFA